MIMEDTSAFGMGSPSIAVEYHARTAEALITSLEHNSARHRGITRGLLNAQLEELLKDARPHNFQGTATPKSLQMKLYGNHMPAPECPLEQAAPRAKRRRALPCRIDLHHRS